MTMKFDELKVKRKAGNFKPQRCWISQCKRLILFGCDRQNIPRFAVATREYSTHERPLYPSELLATEKLNRENSPLRNDETWRKIEALLIEIDLMSGSTEDPNSKTFYADLKSKVVQEASKMGAGKIAEGWFGNRLAQWL